MTGGTPPTITNKLIDHLPKALQWTLLDQCSQTQLTFGNIIHESGDALKHIYFPLTGFISLVTRTTGGKTLEVGLIGNEGLLGATLALDVNTTPMSSIVQGSGLSLKITVNRFRQLMAESPDLQRVVRRYLYILVQQLGQMAVCNAFHDVSERLARWLLMTHDRAHSNHFHLTHEFMAKMLGVRRSAVSIAASALQAQELISYTRGQIRVQSRQGLEAAACECYRVGVDAYSSLFSRPNKTSTTPTP